MAHACFVERTGGPEVIQYREHELTQPGPGQVRVAVQAVGVNFIDIYFRTGLYPRPTPFVDGLEGAGVVQSVGEGVTRFSAGDRVAWSSVFDSYATEVNAPANALVAIPEGVDSHTAAAAMLQGMTADYLVDGVRQTKAGDTALVHAAAGGVGLLLVQMLIA